MKKLKSLSTITIAICIATACFTGCKKEKKVELTGELEKYAGIWECTGRFKSSGAVVKPEDQDFVHDLIITTDGCYNLVRADNIIEFGKITNAVKDTESSAVLTFSPFDGNKDEYIYWKGGKPCLIIGNQSLIVNKARKSLNYDYQRK